VLDQWRIIDPDPAINGLFYRSPLMEGKGYRYEMHWIKRSLRWQQCVAWLGILCLMLLQGCGSPAKLGTGAQEPLRMTLWQGVNPPPNREVLQRLVDRFNQTHPQIQVESLYVGQPDQQMPKIFASVVGNASPDLLWFNPTLTGQLVELDAILPIEDWLNQSAVKSELDPALLSSMTLENHLWSIPFATNNVGIFYRPSLFEAAGIKTLPKTWEDFRAVAKQLTRDRNGDGIPDQHAIQLALGKGEFTIFTWLPFLWSGGSDIRNTPGAPSGMTVDIPPAGAIAALQFWQDLVKDGTAILSQPERGFELDNFLAGKVAMQISGPWTLGQLQQSKTDFDVFPMPLQQQPATALGGENLFLFKSTPERERAAWQFMEYVLSEGFQTEWALGTGYLPVNLKSRQSPKYQAFMQQQPALTVFLEQMKQARSRPLFAGYNRVSEQLGRALESVLLLKQTPQSAIQEAQQRINLILSAQP
jgi:multiple sugar transport system substrate-binding protein